MSLPHMTFLRSRAARASKPLLGLAALLSLGLVACGGSDPHPDATHSAGPSDPVHAAVAVAEVRDLEDQFVASGSVLAVRSVQPGTKILGRIDRVAVRPGDRVDAGGLLARLESGDLQAAVAQAEAAVAMAQAQLDNARAQHGRMTELHERGSVTAKNLEDAVAGLRVAEAGVEQAQANVRAARVTLGYAEIRSPFAGWVVAKHAEEGDMARPGAPLFTVEDLSRVKVEVRVPEADVVGLSEGDSVTVEVLDLSRAGTIDRIVPSADAASRTFAVQVLLNNDDGLLKSGMFARVAFARGQRRALTLPVTAIVERGQLRGAWIVDGDGRARLRWLRLGTQRDDPAYGHSVEVLSGLDGGERYLVSPPPALAEGSLIREVETSDEGGSDA